MKGLFTAVVVGALLPAGSAAQVADPTTVNGQVIGPAADFATPGPARVCMRDMVIQPREGETVYLSYSGIHGGALRLRMQDGQEIEFSTNEIFLSHIDAQQGPVWIEDGVRYYGREDGPDASYLLFTYSDFYGEFRPSIVISGSGVAGNRSDRSWINRLSLEADRQDCTRRFNFGWGVILGEEPLSTTRNQAP